MEEELTMQIKEDSESWSALNKLDLKQFLEDTKPKFFIWNCRMGKVDCTLFWKRVMTYRGVCLELDPSVVKRESSKIQTDYEKLVRN